MLLTLKYKIFFFTFILLISLNSYANELNNDNLIEYGFEAKLNNDIEISDFLVSFLDTKTNKLYIPIQELLETLGAYVKFTQHNVGNGWLINKNNKIKITPEYIQLSDQKINFISYNQSKHKYNYVIIDNILYISTEIFDDLFNNKTSFDYLNQNMNIDSKNLLWPIEKIQKLKSNKTLKRKYAQDIIYEDKILFKLKEQKQNTKPVLYINKNISNILSDDNDVSQFTNINITQKLLGLNLRLEYYGNDNNSTSEVTLSKIKVTTDKNKNKIISEYKFGDISLTNSPLISSFSSRGIGFYATNNKIKNKIKFDKIDLEGFIKTGWYIELYRNNILINNYSQENDNRYLFKSVQLLSGMNNFKLIFYGPYGEKEVKEERYLLSSNLAPEKSFNYEFSTILVGRGILEKLHDNDLSNTNNYNDIASTLNINYGISNFLSLFFNMSSLSINNNTDRKRNNFISTGFHSSIFGNTYKISIAKNLSYENNFAFLFETAKSFKASSLNYKFYNYHNYIDNDLSLHNQPMDNIHDLNFYTNINLGKVKWISSLYYNFNIKVKNAISNVQNVEMTNTFNLRFDKATINKTFNYSKLSYSNNNITNSSRLNGFLSINNNDKRNIDLRGDINYNISNDDIKLNNINLSARKSFNKNKYTLSSIYSYSFDNNIPSSLSTSIAARNKEYFIGFNNTINTNFDFYFGFNIGLSLFYNDFINQYQANSSNLTNQNMLLSKLFLDNNNNNIFDKGDENIEGISIINNKSQSFNITDANGIIYNNLQNHIYANIEINTNDSTLDNRIYSPNKGETILTDEFSINYITFPLYYVGEIEGYINIEDLADDQEIKSYEILLIDNQDKVVAKTNNNYLGFFHFKNIKFDNYKISINSDNLKQDNLFLEKEIEVYLNKEEDISIGNEIILKKIR